MLLRVVESELNFVFAGRRVSLVIVELCKSRNLVQFEVCCQTQFHGQVTIALEFIVRAYLDLFLRVLLKTRTVKPLKITNETVIRLILTPGSNSDTSLNCSASGMFISSVFVIDASVEVLMAFLVTFGRR